MSHSIEEELQRQERERRGLNRPKFKYPVLQQFLANIVVLMSAFITGFNGITMALLVVVNGLFAGYSKFSRG